MPAEPFGPAEVQLFSNLVAGMILLAAVIWAVFHDVSPLMGLLSMFTTISD